MVPIASFLAGALLSLLLPVLLLLALVVWYDVLFRRAGEPVDASDLEGPGADVGGPEPQPGSGP
jgi:hypothetical protein